MSEDRHTFSDPRPVPGLALPTWEVDVFRDGVPEPILTLQINENNLPPRKSKKKKVSWKLPDTLDQTPRFGVDEKKRLLDLFKNLKKERRKSKLKPESISGGDDEPLEGLEDEEEANDQDGKTSPEKEVETPPSSHGLHKLSLAQSGSDVSAYPPLFESSAPQNGNKNSDQQARATKPPPGLSRRHSMPLPPGISPEQPPTNGASAEIQQQVAKPPPGLAISRAQSMPMEPVQSIASAPPPGLSLPNSAQTSQPPQQQSQQYPNPQQFETRSPQTNAQQPQSSPPPSAGLPAIIPPTTLPIPLIPPSRCFNFPPTMPPDFFAQQAANLYISLLQSGQVDELLLYFTLTAQKSLALRSAKSICRTASDMKNQLASLVGCVFAVQGVTLQQGLNYFLLVSSGICQLQGQPLFFCHTLILVPVPGTMTSSLGIAPSGGLENDNASPTIVPQYQIQNDALVLLASD